MTKKCSKCGQHKERSNYYKSRESSDGIRPECKACKSITDAVYSKENSVKRTATAKAWRLKYPERHRQHKRDYYARQRAKANA